MNRPIDEESFKLGFARGIVFTVALGAVCALVAFKTWQLHATPARNDLPPFIRARAIRTQGQEPAVRLQFRIEPSRGGTQPIKPTLA